MINAEELNMDDNTELLSREIERLKNNDQELYSLDRQRAATMSDIQQKVTKIQTEQEAMKEDLQEFKKDLGSVKDKVEVVDSKVDKVETKVDSIQSEVSQVKGIIQNTAAKTTWTPKDKAIIIVALISLAGTIITAFLK